MLRLELRALVRASDRAGGGGARPRDQVQQRRLTGAVGPGDLDDRPRAQAERGVAYGPGAAEAVTLPDGRELADDLVILGERLGDAEMMAGPGRRPPERCGLAL